MRAQRTLSLGPGRDVTVLEARVRHVRLLLDRLDAWPKQDVLTLIRTQGPDLLALLAECLILPADEGVDDLSVSESALVLGAWWELHADFFAQALAALGLVSAAPTTATARANSTARSSSSPPVGSSPPGTTAGDSSNAVSS